MDFSLGNIVGAVQGAEESIKFLQDNNIETIAAANVSSFLGFTQYLASDFAGISMSGLNSLTTDVEKIINDVEAIMQNFGQQQSLWEEGLQGKVQAEAINYVEAIKNLLIAYVTSLKDLLNVANTAAHKLAEADTANTGNVQNANQAIQGLSQTIFDEANSAANQIDVDGLGY